MSEKPQSYEHHTAWSPLFHFVATPIALLNIVVAARHAWYTGGRYAWWNVVFAFGVACGIFVARLMALAVQDRVIRLEMRLRLRELLPAAQHGDIGLRELLPAAQHGDIGRLTVRQMVALRFAGDAELPGLVQRVLKGELVGEKAIKGAVKDWQADWQRC